MDDFHGSSGFRLAAMALSLVLFGFSTTARAEIPVDTYGKLPKIELVRISPSGNHIALIAVTGESRKLMVVTSDGKLVKAGAVGDAKVRDLNWAGDEDILLTTSVTANQSMDFGQSFELGTMLRVALNDTKTWAVFEQSHSVEHTVQGYYGSAERGGRRTGYFGGITEMRGGGGPGSDYVFEHGFADLYRVDLTTGDYEIAVKGNENSHHWVVANDGRIIAHSDYNQKSGLWRVFGGDHDALLFEKTTPTDDIALLGLGRTPGSIVLVDDSGADDVIEEIDTTNAKATVLFETNSIRQFIFDPVSRLLLGAITLDEKGSSFFDPRIQAKVDGMRKAFPGRNVRLESFGEQLDKMIVETDGAADSGTYWLVDVSSGKAVPLGFEYPDIKGDDVGATSLVKYHAADGLAIEGVLTLPPHREVKQLPLLVMPHGGPEGVMDILQFDWLAQAFASRGYAVFQPNFRGSGGYGHQFRAAGDGQWGRKMLTDLSDGVVELARQNIIDPKRVCIFGASYGGYAALAGVTLQHGIYRCAISWAGVSDMPMFSGWQIRRYGPTNDLSRYMRKITGVDVEGEGVLREISPAAFANKADAPILLMHGKDDTRVPIEQSEYMASALKRAGKPFDFITVPREDHFLSLETTRTALLKTSTTFLEKYNPP
jgi:dipeptidyl aminopeptidase/acylaminoacyl peptidase